MSVYGDSKVVYYIADWIYVKWDNGTHNAYRYGEEGKSDIVETQHHPRLISPDSQKLDFGVRVIRGRCT